VKNLTGSGFDVSSVVTSYSNTRKFVSSLVNYLLNYYIIDINDMLKLGMICSFTSRSNAASKSNTLSGVRNEVHY
jgi:hypothetical protein